MNLNEWIHLKSYAKINLYLEVLNKRQDGYHNIRTVFQTVSLYDKLRIKAREQEDEKISFILEKGVLNVEEEDNLIIQTFHILRPYWNGEKKGFEVRLEKNIPIGGGLGGGSSNAAVVLVGLNRHYQMGLSDEQLMDLGLDLGSDVPFFIRGGLARGEGIGERLSFYKSDFCFDVVVVYPHLLISTQEVYRFYDDEVSDQNDQKRIDRLLRGFELQDLYEIGQNIYNSFEKGQMKRNPILGQIKQSLLDCGAYGSLMSGTGSCVFGIFEKFEKEELKKRLGIYGDVFFVKSVI